MSVRKILVPLDGSRFAEAAVPLAVRLARAAMAQLHLVLAHEPSMALVPAADVPVDIGPDDLELRGHEQAYLTATACELKGRGLPVVKYKLLDGWAGAALTGEIEEQGPDLVVMATHGRGPLSRLWLGSVADYVIRHVSVPVLLLRPRDGDATPAPEPNLRCILVPLDPSQEPEAMFTPLIHLALLTQAHITLLHVVQPIVGLAQIVPYPAAMPEEQLESQRVDALRDLDRIASRLRAKGLAVNAKIVVGHGVASTILEQLDRERVDCVAIAAHSAGTGDGRLLGRIADKVIRGASKPVLVLRAES